MLNRAETPGEGRGTGAAVLGVIPARLGSSRLPGKPLRSLAGRPLIEWVWRRAAGLGALDELVVATDAPEVVETVEGFGGRAVLTRTDHASGTDRVAEVAERPEYAAHGWIVNLQGDEPFLPEGAVEAALERVRAGGAGGYDVGTAAARIGGPTEWRDPTTVKVVCGDDGRALYFSRAPIPYRREGAWSEGEPDAPLKHIGLYAFRRSALRRATRLGPHRLELSEGLEQLRWLAAGLTIGVALVEAAGPGVDTEEDLVRAEEILKGREGGP